jgi:AcrR family transcriptional regulator
MPPIPKTTKEDILEAAMRLIRSGGIAALNARAVADEVGCSTQPIFRLYKTMEELKSDAIIKVGEYFNRYHDEKVRTLETRPYRASGMAFIQFAKDERELFRLLFMRDRTNERLPKFDTTSDDAVKMVMQATGFDYDTASKLHIKMWIVVQGIATMIITSYMDMSDELIDEILTDTYQGLVLQAEKGAQNK